MVVKQYLLSAEDIQELIDLSIKRGRLDVVEAIDEENGEDYLRVQGQGILRTYDKGKNLIID